MFSCRFEQVINIEIELSREMLGLYWIECSIQHAY